MKLSEQRGNKIIMKSYNPLNPTIKIDGNIYSITQDAVDDYRASVGQAVSEKEIIRKLIQRFPGEHDFNTSHVGQL